MTAQYHNAWFINFSGIGNGIVITPILRCFEKTFPLISYYHTENQILSDGWFIKKAGLNNLKGFSPKAWRRFNKEDWKAINRFIQEKNIDLIVNLRNEGPRYDTGYYQFKEAAHKEKLDLFFWDLNFDVIQKRTIQQNLTNDILAMLKIQDINTSCYNSRWLASISKNMANLSGIGFGMAASQKNKRWPTAKWLKLANAILLNSDQKIIIFSGNSAEETKQAQDIFQMIGEKRCKLISRQSLKDVAAQIGGLECLVSNDTGLLHIASAANVPAIGLYMNTDPNIWSPRDKTNFIACQNSFMKKCPNSKPYCGNCFHYYDICPAIKQYGDDIEPLDVFEHIVAMLTQNLIFSCSVNFLDSRLVFN